MMRPTRCRGLKPRVLRAAYSPRRSRAFMAMVLARTPRITPMTSQETAWMARRMAEVISTKLILKAASVSVRVSAREFLKAASMAPETGAARSGRATWTRNQPTLSAWSGAIFFRVSLR